MYIYKIDIYIQVEVYFSLKQYATLLYIYRFLILQYLQIAVYLSRQQCATLQYIYRLLYTSVYNSMQCCCMFSKLMYIWRFLILQYLQIVVHFKYVPLVRDLCTVILGSSFFSQQRWENWTKWQIPPLLSSTEPVKIRSSLSVQPESPNLFYVVACGSGN